MISDKYHWECITPESGHFMFGYYDRCPWDVKMRYHLALRIPQHERLPRPGETATVGIIDANEGFQFIPIADTRAWCHQQGSMTLFFKHDPDLFCFNDFEDEEGGLKPVTRIYHVEKGLQESLPFHTYCHSADGRWSASIDFSRITRRGYSYADAIPEGDVCRPDNDGVWIVDIEKGTRSLIATYDDLIAQHPNPWELEGCFLWLNHLIFNCDSSRLMVLLRYRMDGSSWWKTFMYTMRLDGSDLVCSLPDCYWMTRCGGISHQVWGRTPREILIDPGWSGKKGECVVFQEGRSLPQAQRISEGIGADLHMVFSPDGKWIAGHTDISHEGLQQVVLIRVSDGKAFTMGTFRHLLGECKGDTRCDLHVRWSPDGNKITLDSIDSGERKIYMLDLEKNFPR